MAETVWKPLLMRWLLHRHLISKGCLAEMLRREGEEVYPQLPALSLSSPKDFSGPDLFARSLIAITKFDLTCAPLHTDPILESGPLGPANIPSNQGLFGKHGDVSEGHLKRDD